MRTVGFVSLTLLATIPKMARAADCPDPPQRPTMDFDSARASFECADLAMALFNISTACFDIDGKRTPGTDCDRTIAYCEQALKTKNDHQAQHDIGGKGLEDIKGGWL